MYDMMRGWGGQPWSFMTGWWWPLLGIVMLWSLIWKGLALWKAARKGTSVWFVILLLVNTGGILDILYLYVFSKKSHSV
jgi:methionyl-tRNA synthetase